MALWAQGPWTAKRLAPLCRFGVADLLGVLLVLTLSLPSVASQLLADAGTGWHIRLGQTILDTARIPWADSMTQLGFGRAWIDWSWASDVLWAQAHGAGGLFAVCMLTIVAEVVFVALTWRLVAQRCDNVVVCLVLCVAVVGLSFVHLLARPHVLAWSLCLLAYDQVDKRPTCAGWRGWPLGWVFVVWANVHPSFALGLVMVALMLVAQTAWGHMAPRVHANLTATRTAWLLAALCAATMLTPYGPLLHAQMWRLLGRTELLAAIDEYRSLDIHTALGGVYMGLVLVGLWALGTEAQPLWRLWTFMLAAYVGLLAQRNVPFAAALMAASMAQSIDRIWSRWRLTQKRFGLHHVMGFAGTFAQNPSDARMHIWAFAACLSVGLAVPWLHQSARYQMPQVTRLMPFVETLVRRDVKGGVLCDVQSGGALGFASQGRIMPLLDDRFELVSDAELQALQSALLGEANWQAYVAAQQLAYIFVTPGTAFALALAAAPHWHLIAHDTATQLWHHEAASGA